MIRFSFRAPSPRRVVLVATAAAMAIATGSCAYYNTFYKAKDYYFKGTAGAPYLMDKPEPAAMAYFTKSIDYSKKLLALYPKSKWVDDAYLLWARGLMGKDDPLETMNMLRDFPTRYPQSGLKDEALFYLGAAGRRARKYKEALAALDEFLSREPKHDLTPYALMERARVLVALDRPIEAAASASQMLERFPRHRERFEAMQLRAEALLSGGDTEKAREDYRLLGTRANSDAERFDYLLKEADCLEAARRYDEEVALLQEAQGHEQEPLRVTGTTISSQPNDPASAERWGRLMIRIGTAHALAGRERPAQDAYGRVVTLFPRTQLSAEAQFRLAYSYETMSDDFEIARKEYAKVQSQSPASQFATQASQRLATLERLSQYRSGAGPDSAAKQVEAEFLLAEQYLFQLDKPERAIEQYQTIAREHEGTAHAGKALNAEAWVLRNKLERPAEADSLLWQVVRNYPKTEAQVDARDYLERYGYSVPPEMIQRPEPARAVVDTTVLTPPPARLDSLGVRRWPTAMDSLMRMGLIRAGDQPPFSASTRPATPTRPATRDSLRGGGVADSTGRLAPPSPQPATRDTTQTVPDSLTVAPTPVPPDSVQKP